MIALLLALGMLVACGLAVVPLLVLQHLDGVRADREYRAARAALDARARDPFASMGGAL